MLIKRKHALNVDLSFVSCLAMYTNDGNVNVLRWQRWCTRAVPASATKADKKLKSNALNTVNPDCNKTPKSPTCRKSES